jgi:hypothetical protein
MKKLIVILACMMAAVASYAQGTVNFNTRIPGIVDFKVQGANGTFLQGSGFTAQLYGGPVGGALSPLTPTASFRDTAAGAGYINPAGTVIVPGVAGGKDASLQLRVWNNAGGTITSYESALESGTSPIFTVTLGDPNASPPTVPADLTGLGTAGAAGALQLQLIPEPTTIALGLLGAALLLIRRRK